MTNPSKPETSKHLGARIFFTQSLLQQDHFFQILVEENKSHVFNHCLNGLIWGCLGNMYRTPCSMGKSMGKLDVFGSLQSFPLTPPFTARVKSITMKGSTQETSSNKAIASLHTHWPFPPFLRKASRLTSAVSELSTVTPKFPKVGHAFAFIELDVPGSIWIPLKNMTSSVGMMTFPTEWAVYLPLWKIWKSVGMIIPNIWNNKIHVPNHHPEHYLNLGYTSFPMLLFSDVA